MNQICPSRKILYFPSKLIIIVAFDTFPCQRLLRYFNKLFSFTVLLFILCPYFKGNLLSFFSNYGIILLKQHNKTAKSGIRPKYK